MLRDLTDAQKFVVTAMTGLQYRCISGSDTYIKETVMQTFTSECGKIWPTPFRRNSGKVGERHLTHVLVCVFLEVYVSQSALGKWTPI